MRGARIYKMKKNQVNNIKNLNDINTQSYYAL